MNIIEDHDTGYIVDLLEESDSGKIEIVLVELAYPRQHDLKCVEVGLLDVRAADSIRIYYDFDRDGWSILQASVFEWNADDTVQDADWREVAFVPAWGRKGQGSE